MKFMWIGPTQSLLAGTIYLGEVFAKIKTTHVNVYLRQVTKQAHGTLPSNAVEGKFGTLNILRENKQNQHHWSAFHKKPNQINHNYQSEHITQGSLQRPRRTWRTNKKTVKIRHQHLIGRYCLKLDNSVENWTLESKSRHQCLKTDQSV